MSMNDAKIDLMMEATGRAFYALRIAEHPDLCETLDELDKLTHLIPLRCWLDTVSEIWNGDTNAAVEYAGFQLMIAAKLSREARYPERAKAIEAIAAAISQATTLEDIQEDG